MQLDGKVVIVTGASVGIGRAYCQALAQEGATVVAAARSAASLAETVRACEGLPGRVVALVCDVEVEADIVRLIQQTVANFGRIDALVNNAGIYPHHDTLGIDVETWEQSLRVNVRGPFLAIREAAPQMIRQGFGSIVNITSAAALGSKKGEAGHDDLMLYGVTKAALNRLSTFMAEDLKEHGVAVNALSPGPVDTDTWNSVDPKAVADWKALGVVRPCTAEAIGGPVVFLVQQSAAGVTGQVLHTAEFRKSWP